jgi:hypothetical protein
MTYAFSVSANFLHAELPYYLIVLCAVLSVLHPRNLIEIR